MKFLGSLTFEDLEVQLQSEHFTVKSVFGFFFKGSENLSNGSGKPAKKPKNAGG